MRAQSIRPFLMVLLLVVEMVAGTWSVPDATVRAEGEEVTFGAEKDGFIRNWYVLGPLNNVYTGEAKSEGEARKQLIQQGGGIVDIGALTFDSFTKHEAASQADWILYDQGANLFVEKYKFYFSLTETELLGLTGLRAEQDMAVSVRLWSNRGRTEVWCNGVLVDAVNNERTVLQRTVIQLPLRQGNNLVVVRSRELGSKNTPQLLGLQLIDEPTGVQVTLPGDPQEVRAFDRAIQWLHRLRVEGDQLVADEPPPAKPPSNPVLTIGKTRVNWPYDQTSLPLTDFMDGSAGHQFTFLITAGKDRLQRKIDLPQLTAPQFPVQTDLQLHRAEIRAADKSAKTIYGLMLRAFEGELADDDSTILQDVLKKVNNREDTSDFYMAALLRLYAGGRIPETYRDAIRDTALHFRYWRDEKGVDGMSLGTENHRLLFHSAQMLAGQLWPRETFTRSSRLGKEQYRIGRERVMEWLDQVEKEGFSEFLSSSYMPVTMMGLLNLVDLCDNPAIQQRARAQLDVMFRQLATHSFGGLTAGPQGRIYRAPAIYPESGGAQAMLSYATLRAVLSRNAMVSAFMADTRYEPPTDLETLMTTPVDKSYTQSDATIRLLKTADYMVSSIDVPKPAPGLEKRTYVAGKPGMQEHLWDVTLDPGTRVFVNHPGASFEASGSRPGYWNGNGTLPFLQQQGSRIVEVFHIPEEHPIGFTHLFWPQDRFDEQMPQQQDGWLFGRKGTSYIAIWCSEPLEPYADILMQRELRAYGRHVAWVSIASAAAESGTFADFMARCRAQQPVLDREQGALRMGERQ